MPAAEDLEYAVELGVRVTRAAVGLGVHLALAPVRLALRAVIPPAPEPRWAPIEDPVMPAGAADAAPVRAVPDPDTGPGPEIHIEPPWPGYDDMNVAAVVARCRGANPTVVMMVRLYEQTHKNRRGVLQATGG
jgi:hypothetical protein